MKLFQKHSTKRITAFLLMAGLLCSGLSYSQRIPCVSAASDTTEAKSAESTAENAGQKAEGADVMVKELGATTFYRWEKITSYSGLYDEDDWTRIMFVNYKEDGYIAARVEEDLFFDEGIHSGVSSLKNHTTSKYDISSAKGSAWSDGLGNLDEHYIDQRYWGKKWEKYPEVRNMAYWSLDKDNIDIAFLPDRAFNFQNKDPMIQTDRDVFFTDDDRNVPYVRYRGKNKNGCREWDMAFAKDDQSKKYYLDIKQIQTGLPVEDAQMEWVMGYPFPEGSLERSSYDRGGMNIHPEGEDHKGVFLRINSNGLVYIEDSTATNRWDDEYFLTITRDAIHGCYVRNMGNWDRNNIMFTAYKGTPMHFSTLDGETVVSENMVFNVSEGKYVDANGKKKKTQGVMIGNGGKLVIDGGVVSVKGTLINNGTIEIKNGGVLLIQDGASISSFMAGSDIDKNGCGSIKCCGGDIVIEKGGALYAGMNDSKGKIVPFYLDNCSNLINCGLLVYGEMRLGKGTRVEMRGNSSSNGSTTIGNVFKGAEYGGEYYYDSQYFDPDEPKDMERFNYYKSLGWRLEETWLSDRYKIYANKKGDPIYPDDEYDILSNYSKRLTGSPNAIPAGCEGLHIVRSVGGMTGPDPGSVTIIQKKYAQIDSVTVNNEKQKGFNINYDEGL
ncbi:MAG: hypothetical protein K6F00_04395 [Lachnospiraceae bacterium]|nr:hypothetical protein [Lachnospiraceae bacterium]